MEKQRTSSETRIHRESEPLWPATNEGTAVAHRWVVSDREELVDWVNHTAIQPERKHITFLLVFCRIYVRSVKYTSL